MTCKLFLCVSASCFLQPILSLPLHAAPPTPVANKGEVSGQKQAKPKAKTPSLYRNAHILVTRGQHTIIPKGSIIYLPSKDKAKVTETPSGKFTFWPDFVKKNKNWIWLYEVTLKQARGIEPIPEAKLKEFAKLNRTVVATYRKNPISIIPRSTKDSKNKEEKK